MRGSLFSAGPSGSTATHPGRSRVFEVLQQIPLELPAHFLVVPNQASGSDGLMLQVEQPRIALFVVSADFAERFAVAYQAGDAPGFDVPMPGKGQERLAEASRSLGTFI